MMRLMNVLVLLLVSAGCVVYKYSSRADTNDTMLYRQWNLYADGYTPETKHFNKSIGTIESPLGSIRGNNPTKILQTNKEANGSASLGDDMSAPDGIKSRLFYNGQRNVSSQTESPVKVNSESCPTLEAEITIVTAFFYLGEQFPKGKGNRKSDVYFEWIKIFQQIYNPVVAYFGREQDAELFRKLRSGSKRDKTRIVLLNTTDMWAFWLQDLLRKKLNSSDTGRNIVHDYNSIQHAKYEVLLKTTEENPFCTRYIQWLDIGLFRSLIKHKDTAPFSMWLPPDYNQSCVAYTGVRQRSISRDPGDIIINDGCWLVGATVLANITLMELWAKGYMAYTEETIRKYKVLRYDQQVLYSWVNTNNSVLPVQEYRGGEGGGKWFYLGYRCRRAGMERDLSRAPRD